MKKQKKLTLNALSVSVLASDQLARAAGGVQQLSEKPNCSGSCNSCFGGAVCTHDSYGACNSNICG